MEITVAFTTQLKAALGKAEQSVSMPDGATVLDAIKLLCSEHPDAFSSLVMANGELLPSVLLSLNDQQVDADHTLNDGDVVTLLSAISGG